VIRDSVNRRDNAFVLASLPQCFLSQYFDKKISTPSVAAPLWPMDSLPLAINRSCRPKEGRLAKRLGGAEFSWSRRCRVFFVARIGLSLTMINIKCH